MSKRGKQSRAALDNRPRCIVCGQPVREIGGNQITGGKAANWRHDGTPCAAGDPLFDEQVR